MDPDTGGAAVAELRDGGFLEPLGRGGLLGVAEERKSLHQVLKSLGRYPLFERPGLAFLSSYLGEHYTQQERSQIHESLALLPNDLTRVAGFVSSVEWLQSALARTLEASPALEAARELLAFFTERRDRIALRDLEEYFPGRPREDLCAGLRLGVQRFLFYLGLRHADLEVLVGIWPAAARRLRRLAVVLAPEPVNVDQLFGHPFLVEDMTTLLAASRGQPIPLRRGDDKPFTRYVEEAGGMLLTLPRWLEGMTGLTLESRIALALQALRITGLLGAAAASGSSSVPLGPGPGADEWIRGSIEERTRRVVDRLCEGEGRPRLFALLEDDWLSEGDRQAEFLPWLVQAFASVPVTGCIRFADFAEYQAALGSPLGTSPRRGVEQDSQAGAFASEEAIEELWKSFLGIFLGRCLLSLGGAEAGLDPDGKPGFRMTDNGLRLLGIPAGAHPPARDSRREPLGSGGRREETPLIVQPNFEIVFLAPAPAAEAELGRFCERIGREIGVLFRINRQSLQKAAAAGMNAEDLVTLLSRRSRNQLPANVMHEIRGWGAQVPERGAE